MAIFTALAYALRLIESVRPKILFAAVRGCAKYADAW
jgi:hypothetical protein